MKSLIPAAAGIKAAEGLGLRDVPPAAGIWPTTSLVRAIRQRCGEASVLLVGGVFVVWWLFVKGLGIGIAIAAPIGPVGVLCIRRTLYSGRLMGLASGFGAAVADALYGLIAAFGITLVAEWLLAHEGPLRGIGGLFLVVMGTRALLRKPASGPAAVPRSRAGLVGAFGSTFVLTLTNPVTLMAFLGVFATIGLAQAGGSAASASILVLGVFVGSALWWLILAFGAGHLRGRLEEGGMRSINLLSGVILLGFGLYAWASIVLSTL